MSSANTLFAQPTLVKDLNHTSKSALSKHEELISANGLLYFTAFSTANGLELWKNDGNTTTLIKDITPGSASSVISQLTSVNNLIYFTANTSPTQTQSVELWKTDGTLGGTTLVKDIRAGMNGSNPVNLVNVNGTLFFSADDGVNGRELWKSDGTAAGTVMVRDIVVNTASANPANLVNVNGTLFFTVAGQLWKSNGTATTTVLVKNVGGNPGRLMNVNGTLFFTAHAYTEIDYEEYTTTGGIQIWKSNGTTTGTVVVTNVSFGPILIESGFYQFSMISINNTLYFTGENYDYGYTLYKTDGTATGTIALKSVTEFYGDDYATPYFTAIGNTLYFKAGNYLWKSNGTAAGTLAFKDVDDGPVHNLTHVNGSLFFAGSSGKLWKSNGTTVGTAIVKTTGTGEVSNLTTVNNNLYFTAYTADTPSTGSLVLWKSNGIASGTIPVENADTGITGGASPVLLGNINGTVFFSANDGINGYELWKTNGTDAGTILVKDIYPGATGSNPSGATVINNILYFAADNAANGQELWKSDGTAVGTVLVKDIIPDSTGAAPANLTSVNNTLYFTAYSSIFDHELWKSDGTAAGTVRVADINKGAYGSSPQNLINVNGTLFFTANDGSGAKLWKSNGTITSKVKDVYPYDQYFLPVNQTVFNGLLYFTGSSNGLDYELWKSDGTATGTVLVKNINPEASSTPFYLTVSNNTLYFNAYQATSGYELWKSNGTTAGTVLVKDIVPGAEFSNPEDLTDVNGTLFFSATDENSYNKELWKSNGTAAGTVRLTNFFVDTDTDSYAISNFVQANGNLYFKGNKSLNGQELWKSDGTTAGTQLIGEIAPGSLSGVSAESSGAISFVKVNQLLYFAANDGKIGQELWKYDATACTTIVKTNPTLQGSGVCAGSNGTITIKASEAGVIYQAYLYNSAIGNAVKGGGDIILTIPAVSLSVGSYVFSIQANGCTVANLASMATITVTNCPPVSCTASGTILREVWTNITGAAISAIPLNTPAASSSLLTSFESPSDAGDNYGARIRGYLCVPANGNYIFYLAGDDNCELYLSTDNDPGKKVKIAYITGNGSWAKPREWTKYGSQKSAPLTLVAGKKYYIEALHKESTGGDNIAVGWQALKETAITVIPGSNLSPYIMAGNGTISRELWSNVPGTAVSSIPVNTAPASTSQLTSFEAPANIADNYGQRIRGYVHPPVNGNYTFYIAGDNNCELWLSTDETLAKKVKIAHITGTSSWTEARNWTKFSTQKSVSIALAAGKKYYIEALHKENANGDNVAVGWQLPNDLSTPVVVPGNRLSPYVLTNTTGRMASLEELSQNGLSVHPNPFDDKVSIQTTLKGKLHITLTDALGRVVYQSAQQADTNKMGIDLFMKGLKPGVYILIVQAEAGTTQTVRLVKQ